MKTERMGQVDFYEIWDGEKLLVPDVGFYDSQQSSFVAHGENATQEAATALAKMLSPTAEAHFVRTGEVHVPAGLEGTWLQSTAVG